MEGIGNLLSNIQNRTKQKTATYKWQDDVLEIIKLLDLPKRIHWILWRAAKVRGQQQINCILADIKQGDLNFKSDLAKEKYFKMLLKKE